MFVVLMPYTNTQCETRETWLKIKRSYETILHHIIYKSQQNANVQDIDVYLYLWHKTTWNEDEQKSELLKYKKN